MKQGEFIKELRLNKGMTQTELANELGVTITSIWNVENGKTGMRLSTLKKASEVLGVTIEELRAYEK